jgi:hypothetical protein
MDMRTATLILAAGAALLASAPLQAAEKLTGEAKLAKILQGREAGTPVSCIPLFAARDMTVIDKTAIVYDSGSTIWVNRTTNPTSLDSDRIMVNKLHISQLCRLDTVEMRDRSGFWFTGFVGLDNFVPYRKAPKDG